MLFAITNDGNSPDPMVVDLATAEIVAGIELLPEHASGVASDGYFRGRPALTPASWADPCN